MISELENILAEGYPFPTPPVWNFMQPHRSEGQNLDAMLQCTYEPYIARFAVETISGLDRAMEENVRSKHWHFMQQVDSPWKIEEAQRGVVDRVAHGLRYENASCAMVFHGVMPAALAVTRHRSILGYDVAFAPTIISGYSGTEGTLPTVLQEIPEQVLTKPVVFALDDIGEKLKAIAAVLGKVEQAKFGESDTTLMAVLTRGEDTSALDELIERMHRAGLVASLLFYKNEHFFTQLSAYIEKSGVDLWSIAQQSMLQHARRYVTHYWLVGHWVDFGSTWGDLYPDEHPFRSFVDEDALRENSNVNVLINQLSGSMFRIGATMSGMYGFPPENAGDVRRFAAEYIADRIAWFARSHAMR